MLATYEINKPSIAFYARSGVVKSDKSNVQRLAEYARTTPMMVITTPGKSEELKEYGFKVIDARNDYILLGTGKTPGAVPR